MWEVLKLSKTGPKFSKTGLKFSKTGPKISETGTKLSKTSLFLSKTQSNGRVNPPVYLKLYITSPGTLKLGVFCYP